MTPSILDMAKELVIEAIKGNALSPDEARDLLENTHAALLRLHQAETGEPAASPEQPGAAKAAPDWKQSIQKHSISCLECGAGFRQLSRRHLSTHELDPRSYRQKYGIPRTQALSAREVTARRKQLAKDIQPWRLAPHAKPTTRKRAAAKA